MILDYAELHLVSTVDAIALMATSTTASGTMSWVAAHCERMSKLAAPLAEALDLPHPLGSRLVNAALLHDVGKYQLPEGLINKLGALTRAEVGVMRNHSRLGADILSEIAARHGLDLSIEIEVSLLHHERWDGAGYPHGVPGREIPLTARAVAVIDVFDALVSERPYKPAWDPDRALEYLLSASGTQFDPFCVGAFAEVYETLPFDDLFGRTRDGWPAGSEPQTRRTSQG